MACHDAFYITPRSKKAWELTVFRMRDLVWNDDDKFSKDDAKRIIEYMDRFFYEESEISPAQHFKNTSPQTVVVKAVPAEEIDPADLAYDEEPETPEVEETAEVVQATPVVTPSSTQKLRDDMPEAMRKQLSQPYKPFSPALIQTAKCSGFTAVLCLFLMVISGHFRKRLKCNFRKIHIPAAIILFISMISHGAIYIMRFGNPPVLWYWLGVASLAVLIGAQLQGILRRKLGQKFIPLHIAAGYSGITLAILHWIIAWL